MIGEKFAELYAKCMDDSTTPLKLMDAAYDEVEEVYRERDALRARVAELEAQHAATLRPRKCDTCHGVQMAEEMRESCAAAVRKLAHMNSAYEDAIRSLPIPVCNPLAPSGD